MKSRIIRTLNAAAAVSVMLLAAFTLACSGQTEAQALEQLRASTRDGKLPAENVVAQIGSRFSGTRTGALARLLQARIKLENGDPAGAARLLDEKSFASLTKVADHAMWLRGSALQAAGQHSAAMNVLAALLRDHPDSVRIRDAKLKWAASAIASGKAVDVPGFLVQLSEANDPEALLLTAKAYESQGSTDEAMRYFRRTYFYGAGSAAAKEAETKLTSLGQPLSAQSADEARERADQLYRVKNFTDAATAYAALAAAFPTGIQPAVRLRQMTVLASLRRPAEAKIAFDAIPNGAKEKEEAYYQLALAYARGKAWPQARSTVEQMRQQFPAGTRAARTMIDLGLEARSAKNSVEEAFYLKTAVAAYPTSVDVAQAQFELAWYEHENRNFARSSQMLVEHLARYVDKDTTNRGKAGYWAARDSELAGRTDDACVLYDAVVYRYSAKLVRSSGSPAAGVIEGTRQMRPL